MRETHVGGVGGQLLRKLAVRQPAIVVFRLSAPRTEMHLVDGNRRVAPVSALRRHCSRRQSRFIEHHRGSEGRISAAKA